MAKTEATLEDGTDAVLEMHELVSPIIRECIHNLPVPEGLHLGCSYLGVVTALLEEAARGTMALQDVDPGVTKDRKVVKEMFLRLAKDVWNDIDRDQRQAMQ